MRSNFKESLAGFVLKPPFFRCVPFAGKPKPSLRDVERIDGQALEFFEDPGRPADFNPVDLGSSAQAEMHAHIIVRDVAGTAAYFIDQNALAGFNADARTNTVAIRSGADSAEGDPMIGVADLVDKQARRRVYVADYSGDAAIIPEVANSQAARRNRVPVVSMMYFFVYAPPKMFVIVRPADLVMSVT